MNNYPLILIDTGILVAFYDRKDEYHQQSLSFLVTVPANSSQQLPALQK